MRYDACLCLACGADMVVHHMDDDRKPSRVFCKNCDRAYYVRIGRKTTSVTLRMSRAGKDLFRCPKCNGRGATSGFAGDTCSTCHGKGVVEKEEVSR